MFSLKFWMRRWLKPSATRRSVRKSNRVPLNLEMLDQRIVPALSVTNDTVGANLVAALLGPDVSASNITLTAHTGSGTTKGSDSSSAGTFTGGTGIIGFDHGIVLSTGGVQNVVGPNTSDSISQSNGMAGDAQLTDLTGVPTNDATVLEFDFVPTFSTITFRYVFSSDEYNEFSNSQFTDAFAFFVNGVNQALIPGTSTPVSINTVNGGNPLGTNSQNPEYYRNNDLSDGGGGIDIEMDGLTTVLTVQAAVNPNQTNHIKMVIADGSDSIYDSNVFIEGGSFVSGDPPVVAAGNGAVSTPEGTPATNTGTFSDPQGNGTVTLSASVGTITPNNNDGTWSWSAPAPDGPAGPTTVTITAKDDTNATATTTFTYAVTNVPVSYDAGPDETLAPAQGGVFNRGPISFTDPGADTWSGTVDYGDGSGTQALSVNQTDKTFSLGHTYSTDGTYTVAVSLQDDDGDPVTHTFSVEVHLNTPPVANPDSASTQVGLPISIPSATLLENDTDAEGDPLTLTGVSPTSANGGNVSLDPVTHLVTYTPPALFSGSDTFTYTVSDGIASSTGTVTVSVMKRSQSIAFDPLPDKTYGDSPFAISATASSGLPVSFSIVSGPATYDSTTGKVTLTGAGDVTIEASQAGDSTYNAATPVDQTFNVAKANPTVTVAGGNFTYDGLEHAATGSIAGVNGEDLGTPTFSYSHTDASGNVVTTTSPPVDPGLYTVTASFAGDDNYESGSATATITIAFDAQSLTDLSGPFHAGRTIPIKLQLTDAAGNNVSSSSIDVTAFRLEQVNADGTTTPTTVQDSGDANPQNLFRYDATLGGYIFNLSTKGLKAGSYNFYWTAGTDPTEHELSFTLI